MAIRPSCRGGLASLNHNFRLSESNIFLRRWLDAISDVFPVVPRRQHSSPCACHRPASRPRTDIAAFIADVSYGGKSGLARFAGFDMGQTIFERHQSTLDNKELGIRSAFPVLSRLLIRGTIVPSLCCP